MATLLIGDIHGCYLELLDLLDKAGLSEGDRIIALGDIVDRGPGAPQVLDFFYNQGRALSLMGNHERKHLRWAAGLVQPAVSQQLTKEQLGEAYLQALDFLETFPLYLELPEAVLVHGFLEPDVPLEAQLPIVLCGVRSGEHYLANRYPQPWYTLYTGEKPVVHGHENLTGTYEPFVYQDRIFGLDTSCVTGGRLTGLLLPSFTFISVASRENYWAQVRQRYSAALPRPGRHPKPPRPAASLPPWDTEAERALALLIDYAEAENRRILAKQNRDPEFPLLTPRQQAKAYAAKVQGSPIERLLHLARRGELSPAQARRALVSPEQALRLAAEFELE